MATTLSFRARAIKANEPVQIWGAVRVKDRENRYVFGLRGGNRTAVELRPVCSGWKIEQPRVRVLGF
jgi:hypothetical protein